ncbi:MAG: hypothetical protein H6835_05895 [Planctomycetes bacterium]|nr:hypothetical protein [Planctomycetota bacterium]
MKLCTALLLSCLAACNYNNAHDSQDSPPTSWVDTDPPGATLLLVRRNLTFRTPVDLGEEVSAREEMEISKSGYKTWRGTLRDIPRSANRSYHLVLEPK